MSFKLLQGGGEPSYPPRLVGHHWKVQKMCLLECAKCGCVVHPVNWQVYRGPNICIFEVTHDKMAILASWLEETNET
jgi:folate-dependent phosphoribosylglycinamide formyltransferase PurN